MPDPDHIDIHYPHEKQENYSLLRLQKFVDVQEQGYRFGETYEMVLSEIKQGQKLSHWIWYVFPQIQGLGISDTTAYFSIKDLNETKEYSAHSILVARLIEFTSVLLDIETDDSITIFGYLDAYNVRSCMTLFKYAVHENYLFQ